MEYFTASKIIEIHDEIIKEYGGTRGIRDEGTLELLVYKINHVKTVFGRAALVLHTIVSTHPFFDGNKRTAIMSAENILGKEGYFLDAKPEDVTNLMLKMAKYECTVEAVENWIKDKARKFYILANIRRALSCRRMDSFRSFFSSGVSPASFSATIVGSIIS